MSFNADSLRLSFSQPTNAPIASNLPPGDRTPSPLASQGKSITSSPSREHGILADENPWLLNWAYPLGCRCVIPGFFSKIEIRGRDRVPREGPTILAPVHRSRWDALVLGYAIGRSATGRHPNFMVSATEMRGVQGWFIRQMGGFPIDQKHPGISSLRLGIELLTHGRMLAIFPEGSIFRDDRVHPLKTGLARIALQAQARIPDRTVRIVPVAITYSQPYPQWGCQVAVNIGHPLTVPRDRPQGSKTAGKALTERLYQSLSDLMGSSSGADNHPTEE